MKHGVDILNTVHEGIICEATLFDDLKSGKVTVPGIDTWEVEPPDNNQFREIPQGGHVTTYLSIIF